MFPRSGRCRLGRDGDAGERVDRGQRVGAGVGDRPGDRADVGDVRRQLDEERQVGGAPDGRRDGAARPRRRSRTGCRPLPTFGQLMLSSMPAMPGHAVEPARDLGVVGDRLAGDVDDHRHPPAGPRRGVLLDDRVDAGVLEPDRVEHPARRLGHARRRVADPRPERRALAADRAEPLDLDDVAVLDPVAERPRGDEDRILEAEAPAQVDRQVDGGARRRRADRRRARRRARPTRRTAASRASTDDVERRGPAGARAARIAGLIRRTVGRRFVGAPGRRSSRPPLRLHQPPSQSSSSEAKTGPSRQTRCGVPGGRHDDAAEARADRAAHVLLHRDLEECLPPRLRRAGGDRPPGAALPAQAGDAEPAAARRRERGQRLGASAAARTRTPGRPTPRTRARGP